MGRRNTRNLNMPPHMHPRVQRSGKTYYYMYTQGKPRKEIALGPDYILALQKYAELNIVDVPQAGATFGDVITKYETDTLPTLSKNTQRTQKSDIKHLRAVFGEAPLSQVKPVNVQLFLQDKSSMPTTANRCKRLISSMWNRARGWGYTDLPNPCEGIKGHRLEKRTVYITDEVFAAVHAQASAPMRDALDLAYLTGQRPADTLGMTEHDIIDGHLIVTQFKTKQALRITVTGELAAVIERIRARKAGYNAPSAALLVTDKGKRVTEQILRQHFDKARKAAAALADKDKRPVLAASIREMWFYDLRAKAADDTSTKRGELAASNLLGHDSVRTTQKHYLRRGKIVAPTK